MHFVFDLDGTICFDGFTIEASIKEALGQAPDFGHELLFASARSYRDCIDVLGESLSQNMVIGLNGGVVYDKGKLFTYHRLDKSVFQRTIDFCNHYHIPYFVDDDFNYASHRAHKIPFIKSVDPLSLATALDITQLHHPIKMVLYMGEHEELLPLLVDELKKVGFANISYHENEKCLYLNPDGITKASTLSQIIGNQFVAFGNDKNDIDMFKLAQYSVQIGDYHLLKDYADEQVEDTAIIPEKILTLFEAFQNF